MNNGDSGPGTLRQAILNAPAGSTITFANSLKGQTIAPWQRTALHQPESGHRRAGCDLASSASLNDAVTAKFGGLAPGDLRDKNAGKKLVAEQRCDVRCREGSFPFQERSKPSRVFGVDVEAAGGTLAWITSLSADNASKFNSLTSIGWAECGAIHDGHIRLFNPSDLLGCRRYGSDSRGLRPCPLPRHGRHCQSAKLTLAVLPIKIEISSGKRSASFKTSSFRPSQRH